MNNLSRIKWHAILILIALNGFAFAETRTIGFIKSKEIEPYNIAFDGFKKELRSQEVDFKLVKYDAQDPQKPDLILTIGSKATEIAMKKAKGIPILFTMVVNPNKSGFSGPTVTGVSMDIPPEKNIEVVKKINPKIRRIGVIYNPKETQTIVNEISTRAEELGYDLILEKTNTLEEVYSAVRSLAPRIDILWMIPDSTVYSLKSTDDVLLHTLRKKIPVVGLSSSYTKAGALFSLSCDYEDIGRQTGEMAIKILQENHAHPMSIVSPRKTLLSVNLIVADRFGIKLPPEILKEAKDVYK